MSEKTLRNIPIAIIILGALLLGAAIGGVVQSMLSSPKVEESTSIAEETITQPLAEATTSLINGTTNTPTSSLPTMIGMGEQEDERENTPVIEIPPTPTIVPVTATLVTMEGTRTIVPVTATLVAMEGTQTIVPITATLVAMEDGAEREETTASPTLVVNPKPTQTLDDVESYLAYRMQEGDTLASLSEAGGSTPDMVMWYNRLSSAEQPVDREIIIPQLVGHTSTLTPALLGVVKGNTKQPWVALTIDCGTFDVHGKATLDALQTTNAKVTFFIHGDTIGNDPDQVQRIVAEGHEIGSHSYTHPNFTLITDEEIIEQLSLTEQKVKEAAGADVSLRPYFRFPFGEANDHATALVIEQGYLPIYWNLNLLDYTDDNPNADKLIERLNTALPEEEMPASIVLMHCSDEVVEALPTMIADLEKRGLEARPLSDVLGP
jgi:peptidoglycan/xylan/chitin deacetylase (PgdA/CDA1 family)